MCCYVRGRYYFMYLHYHYTVTLAHMARLFLYYRRHMTLLLSEYRGTTCGAKYQTEQSTMPHTWWGHLLVSVGATSRYSHRLLIAPITNTVTNHIHYSCHPGRIRCGAKCHTEKLLCHTRGGVTSWYPWGPPLDIHIASSSLLVIQTWYMMHLLIKNSNFRSRCYSVSSSSR